MINLMCFMIMPFIPELNYFYLYLKYHIEKNHGIECQRADEKILTLPILEKIIDSIKKSDLLIADCSGRNPNVFYELGIAHAMNKKVILITQDEIGEAPSDIRHLEFIPYSLDKHIEFLHKIDNALYNILVERYEIYYEPAKEIFKEFKDETNAPIEMVRKEIFISRVKSFELTGDLPPLEDIRSLREFVLPKIIANGSESHIMKQISSWISKR